MYFRRLGGCAVGMGVVGRHEERVCVSKVPCYSKSAWIDQS